MIRPPSLKAGDQIRIISTARKIERTQVEAAAAILESWGLKVEFGEHLFAEHHQMAGNIQERREDLQMALNDRKIKAIFCARGGYGTGQIVDDLDFTDFMRRPKWIVGYSDITVLHNQLAQLGVASLHATMPVNMADNGNEALESLRQALFGEAYEIKAPAHPFNRAGHAQLPLTGGNASIIYGLCGSPLALSVRGKNLFLEEIDEYLYHLDRMFYNFKRNGYFDECQGMIIGGMTDMNDHEIPFGESAEEIIRRHCEPYRFPVAYNFPAGHLKDNRALIFGLTADLRVDENGSSLKFPSGG